MLQQPGALHTHWEVCGSQAYGKGFVLDLAQA